MMTLKQIEDNISPLVEHYRRAYARLANSQVDTLIAIDSHIKQHSGKQLRPLLTLLSACSCGFSTHPDADHPLFTVCAALETLHNASLIHDDIVDQSDTRRGVPTVNKMWSNRIAVLAGDYYLAQVMLAINTVNHSAITAVIARTVQEMSEGELLQLEKQRHDTLDIDIYRNIIYKKTASFMSACCEAGALMADCTPEQRIAARAFGTHIGMAFQMRDDVIDILPTQQTGKPQCNDLREHKSTLPLITAIQNAAADTKTRLLSLWNKETLTEEDIETLRDAIATDCNMQQMRHHIGDEQRKAHDAIGTLPDSPFRTMLDEIADMMQYF